MSTKPSPTPEYAIKRCDFVTQELWHVTRDEKWVCLCNTRESAVAICHAMNSHERLVKALRLLYDNQNGPPLLKYEREWNEAMRQASALLSELEQGAQ